MTVFLTTKEVLKLLDKYSWVDMLSDQRYIPHEEYAKLLWELTQMETQDEPST